MTCSKYEILISVYADGELSGNDLRELESHLAQWEGCRRVLEETSILQRDMSVMLMETPETPDLTELLISRIKPRRTARARWVWAAAAVSAIAAVCAAFFVQADHSANPSRHVPTPPYGQMVKDKPAPPSSTPPMVNPKPRVPGVKAHPIRIWHSPTSQTAIRPKPVNRVPRPMGVEPKSPVPPAPQETAQVTVEYVDGIDEVAIARSIDENRYGGSKPSGSDRPGQVNTAYDTARPGDRNTGQMSYRRMDGTWSRGPGGDDDM